MITTHKSQSISNLKFLVLASLACLVITIQSCKKDSVDEPDPLANSDSFSNPQEYSSFVDSTYVLFWKSLQNDYPNMAITAMSQGISSPWGNWGMRDVYPFPDAVALNNDQNYVYSEMISGPWNGLYEVMGRMNDLLTVMDSNQGAVTAVIGSEGSDEVRANAKALQGLSLGYLSLLYDRAYIVDENSEATHSTLSSYGEVNDKAIEKLSESVQLFQNSNLTMTGWNGLVYDGDNAGDLLKAFIAKFEVLQVRNPMEAQNVDWDRVLQNTEEEIIDLSPTGDGGDQWWQRILVEGQDQGWMRVHQKIIKMMSPNKPDNEVPYPFPDGVVSLPEISDPEDARLTSDFAYINLVNPGRGAIYLSSNYVYKRYEDYVGTLQGPMPFLTSEEVDLLRAEALIRTQGNKAEAAIIINNTGVMRGGLQPLTGAESDEEMLNAISYERIVEFTYHGSCNIWFYRRMITPLGNTDRLNVYYLEPNTARHMPVPGFELNFQNSPIYTFGGDQPEQ